MDGVSPALPPLLCHPHVGLGKPLSVSGVSSPCRKWGSGGPGPWVAGPQSPVPPRHGLPVPNQALAPLFSTQRLTSKSHSTLLARRGCGPSYNGDALCVFPDLLLSTPPGRPGGSEREPRNVPVPLEHRDFRCGFPAATNGIKILQKKKYDLSFLETHTRQSSPLRPSPWGMWQHRTVSRRVSGQLA